MLDACQIRAADLKQVVAATYAQAADAANDTSNFVVVDFLHGQFLSLRK